MMSYERPRAGTPRETYEFVALSHAGGAEEMHIYPAKLVISMPGSMPPPKVVTTLKGILGSCSMHPMPLEGTALADIAFVTSMCSLASKFVICMFVGDAPRLASWLGPDIGIYAKSGAPVGSPLFGIPIITDDQVPEDCVLFAIGDFPSAPLATCTGLLKGEFRT